MLVTSVAHVEAWRDANEPENGNPRSPAPHRMPSRGNAGQAVDARMRPDGVVVTPPFFERGAGLGEGGEQRLVQELVPQATIEALDEGVLHRLARIDVMPVDLGVGAPAMRRLFSDPSACSRQPGCMRSR